MSNSAEIVINFTPLLLVAAVVLSILKLTGVIAWSWWAVTAPIWVPIVLTIALWLLVLAFIGSILVIAATLMS